MSPLAIPQDNPQFTLLEELALRRSFLSEVLGAYEEPIWRRLLEEDLLQQMNLEGRALALSSPQAALWLAFCLSRVDRGDMIFYPLNAPWYGTRAIQTFGAKPFLIDIDNDALGISPKGVKEALSELKNKGIAPPKAMVINHSYGLPCDRSTLEMLAEKEGITLIENASEAYLSARTGDAGIGGGYRILPIGEYAEGRAASGVLLVCPNEERWRRAHHLASRDLREPIQQISTFALERSMLISSMQLLRGYTEFLHAEEKKAKRMAIHQRYSSQLTGVLGLDFFNLDGKSYSYNHMRVLLSVDRSLLHFSKEELRVRLTEAGIEALSLTLPLHHVQELRSAPTYLNGLSEAWYESTLLLPTGSGMKEREIDQICEVITDTVRHYN